MGKVILPFLILFAGITSAQDVYDKKIMSVLYREMNAALKLYKKSPNTRTLYRLYNSRVEILKFKNKKIRKLKFSGKKRAELNKKEKENFSFYSKTKKLGKLLEKKAKSVKILGNYYLLQGLMIYEFEEKSKEIPKYLKRAIGVLKDKELKSLGAGKLAEYYFNERQFNQAIKSFRYAIKTNPRSEWRDRFYFNLAWSYYKLDRFDKAVGAMKVIYTKSTKRNAKNYYFVESIKRIPEFYVFAGIPDKGFDFVLKTKGGDGDALFAFIEHVYSKGFFNKYGKYVEETERMLVKSGNKVAMLKFRINVYNFLVRSEFKKNVRTLTNLRIKILEDYNNNVLSKEQKQEFYVNSTNALNENFKRVNRKGFTKTDKFFKPLIIDTISLLKTLRAIEPNKTKSYNLRIAQLQRKLGSEDKAFRNFERLYNQKPPLPPKERSKLLDEIIVIASNSNEKIPSEKLEFYYKEYLKYGKKPEVKRQVKLKLFDIYYQKKDPKSGFALAKHFHKTYPKQQSQTELMLLKLGVIANETKDLTFLKSLKGFIAGDPKLRRSNQLKKGLDEGYQSVVVTKVNALITDEQGDKAERAEKLKAYLFDKNMDKVNRMIAGFNAAQLYHELGEYKTSISIFQAIIKFSEPGDFSEYSNKILPALNENLFDRPEMTKGLLDQVLAKSCEYGDPKKDSFFKISFEVALMQGNWALVKAINTKASQCRLSNETRNDLAVLVSEYVDYNSVNSVRTTLLLFKEPGIGSAMRIEDVLQEYTSFLLNSRESLDSYDFRNVYSQVGAVATGIWGSRNSPFLREVKSIWESSYRRLKYFEIPLTDETIVTYLEKNLTTFAERLALVNNLKATLTLTNYLKLMSQITLFENFFGHLANFEKLISDQNKVEEYRGLIIQAVVPFKNKYLEMVSSAKQSLNAGLRVRYLSFGKPNGMIFKNDNYEIITN